MLWISRFLWFYFFVYSSFAHFSVLVSTENCFHLSVKSNSHFLWLYITMLSYWYKTLALLSQPIKSKTKTNRDSLTHVFPCFMLLASIWVLIGSLDCLRPLLLARMITLVLVLPNSIIYKNFCITQLKQRLSFWCLEIFDESCVCYIISTLQ